MRAMTASGIVPSAIAGIDVRVRIQQRAKRLRPAVHRGHHERRTPVDIGGIDIGALGEQDAHRVCIAGFDGVDQGRASKQRRENCN